MVNKMIEDLRRIAFDFADISDPNVAVSRKSGGTRDYKKLGFIVSVLMFCKEPCNICSV